jgi:hypothetical protein
MQESDRLSLFCNFHELVKDPSKRTTTIDSLLKENHINAVARKISNGGKIDSLLLANEHPDIPDAIFYLAGIYENNF